MNVVFLSQCEKASARRTALVLDAYAWRKADRAWSTSITQEGLATVRAELRRTATRQSAVACYVVQGRSGLQLAWVVGRASAFAEDGCVPVATTSRPASRFAQSSEEVRARSVISPELRLACLLSSAAGYLHDLGKFGMMFQEKLRAAKPMKDAIRHEWLSLHLLLQDGQLDGTQEDWRAAWRAAMTRMYSITGGTGAAGIAGGIRSARAAVLFLVFTHHRLPTDVGNSSRNMELSDETYFDPEQSAPNLEPAGMPSKKTLALARSALRRIDRMVEALGPGKSQDPLFWRSIVSLARPGLILADHGVSSVDKSADAGHGDSLLGVPGAVFANTVKDEDGRSRMNQQLDWHVQHVGDQAALMLPRMLRFEPPGLSEPVLQRLRAPTEGRFSWQGKCAHALREAQAERQMPTLVFNIAGTGCGKTRMNVAAVAALREGQPVRIATGLNLRSLTLQTRDAYAQQLGMDRSDLACVIGSRLAVRLHDSRQQAPGASDPSGSRGGSGVSGLGPAELGDVDEDGNLPEETFEALADEEADPVPAWLEHFLSRDTGLRPVVMAPVLVCTADFLVRAGDPNEKANHALTTLRLVRSDLVLDEIDSYEPVSLTAVMRLITAAAMWGRHVVASSATLSLPVARALYRAYELGISMGCAAGILPSSDWRQAILDDRTNAHVAGHQEMAAFERWFGNAVKAVAASMGRLSYRPAELLPVQITNPDGAPGGSSKPPEERISAVYEAILAGCRQMHARHRWALQVQGVTHYVSLGLVRVANIPRAVETAKRIAHALPSARVACYHSQLSVIHRFMLERSLDEMLTRHPRDEDPGQALLRNREVREAVEASLAAGRSETSLIVVATPVEEIGRDHDFDWAVIEPSSTQSIVQTAGRVNRHRLIFPNGPNIAVLQFNFREAAASKPGAVCFTRPGLEAEPEGIRTHSTHDLAELIDWDALADAGQIDARLRFQPQTHLFARFDDEATEQQVNKAAQRFMTSDSSLWMGANTYRDVPLREASNNERWTKDEDGAHLREEPLPTKPKIRSFVERGSWVTAEKSPSGAWLSWSHQRLLREAEALGLEPADAFSVEVHGESGVDRSNLVENAAFGYFRLRS